MGNYKLKNVDTINVFVYYNVKRLYGKSKTQTFIKFDDILRDASELFIKRNIVVSKLIKTMLDKN